MPAPSFEVEHGQETLAARLRENVRVITEHMGGGFGSKLGPSATGSAFAVAACKLAKKAGAPVKLMLDHQQEHLCTPTTPTNPVVEVLRERGREIFRQIKGPNRWNAGSIPRLATQSWRKRSGLDAL